MPRALAPQHPEWVTSVSVGATAKLAATGCADTRARLWSLEAGSYSCLRVIEHGGGSGLARIGWISTRLVGRASRLGEGMEALLVGGQDGLAKLWCLPTFDQLKESQVAKPECVANFSHGQTVRGIAAPADISFIASAGGRTAESVVIWWPDPLGSIEKSESSPAVIPESGPAANYDSSSALVDPGLANESATASNDTGVASLPPKRRMMRRASARF
jgi:WD40 repeat protein